MKNMKIISQKENPLFSRKEIEISIETGIAPKTSDTETFIAKEFSTNNENVKIKKIIRAISPFLFLRNPFVKDIIKRNERSFTI